MKRISLLVFVIFVASAVTFAQGFKVTSVGGGVNVLGLLGPSGATETLANGGMGLGFGPFLGFGAKVRATMGSMPNIRWIANVNYDIYQGSGGTPKVTYTQGALGIGLGAEYALKEMKMGSMDLWPYVGGDLQFNTYPQGSTDPAQSGAKYPSGSRIGIGLGGGVEYQLKEGLNLDIGLKLNIANLLLTPSAQKPLEYSNDPKVIWWSSALKTFTSTTSIEEGTLMNLQFRIGINYALK